MSNTFNYSLSDFVITNINGNLGTDFIIDGKNLVVPLSSNWLANITSIRTSVPGLCALDLSLAPRLSTVQIQDPNLVNFVPPQTSNLTLCAIDIQSPVFGVTANNVEMISFQAPQLRNLDLRSTTFLKRLIIVNTPSLSSLQLNAATFFSTVSNIQIVIMGSNLSNQSMDTIFWAISTGYSNNNGGTRYTNASVTVSNPVTGTGDVYNALVNQIGLSSLGVTFNIVQTGLFNGMVFATKL